MSREIFYAGRAVGEIRADGFFQKRLQFSRHLLQKPRQSIAINLDVLDAAERAGAHSCEMIDTESGAHYRASIAKIRAKGFAVNRGQGAQIALPLSDWSNGAAHCLAIPNDETIEPQQAAEQLTLWAR